MIVALVALNVLDTEGLENASRFFHSEKNLSPSKGTALPKLQNSDGLETSSGQYI